MDFGKFGPHEKQEFASTCEVRLLRSAIRRRSSASTFVARQHGHARKFSATDGGDGVGVPGNAVDLIQGTASGEGRSRDGAPQCSKRRVYLRTMMVRALEIACVFVYLSHANKVMRIIPATRSGWL